MPNWAWIALREMQMALRHRETARDRVETSGDSTHTYSNYLDRTSNDIQAEIPLTPTATTSTAPATTSAFTSILLTTTSKPTLDSQISATGVPMQATGDQSAGIKPPIEANCEMGLVWVTWIRADVGDRSTAYSGRQARV